MPCKAHLTLIAVVVLLGSAQMLASCGQKGDLYLPERDAAVGAGPAAATDAAPGRDDDVPRAVPAEAR